jgi:hypothetical protein
MSEALLAAADAAVAVAAAAAVPGHDEREPARLYVAARNSR